MIGIFGGTFNPIHLGHLHLATTILEILHLNKIHLILSANPPHRDNPKVSSEHRFKMLQLAIAENPKLIADDIEMKRNGPSYTVLTLEELKKKYPHEILVLIIGSDSFLNITKWFQWQRLFDFANIVVCKRPGVEISNDKQLQEIIKERQCDFAEFHTYQHGKILLLDIKALNISATNIRKLISTNQPYHNLIPPAVWKYINSNKLYQ